MGGAGAARHLLRGRRAVDRIRGREGGFTDEIGLGWDQALITRVPPVLDVRCDPSMPPIPPRSTLERVRAVIESVVQGDSGACEMIATGLRTKIHEFPLCQDQVPKIRKFRALGDSLCTMTRGIP